MYGSFATNLTIESSDIDLTVKFNNNLIQKDIEQILNKLSEEFLKLNKFESVNPISTASVPVIKLVITLLILADRPIKFTGR